MTDAVTTYLPAIGIVLDAMSDHLGKLFLQSGDPRIVPGKSCWQHHLDSGCHCLTALLRPTSDCTAC